LRHNVAFESAIQAKRKYIQRRIPDTSPGGGGLLYFTGIPACYGSGLLLWPLGNMFFIILHAGMGCLPQQFIFPQLQVFNDLTISIALRNSGIHLFFGIIGVIPLAFMLGFFLSLRKRGFRLFRTIFFLPSMISVAALAMIFLGLYRPDGMLNSFLEAVGLSSLSHVWLANKTTALGAIIAIDIWSGIVFSACYTLRRFKYPRQL
jgi:ABC-type sugar transport system permease subunit